MLVKTCNLFFINPIKDVWSSIKNYIRFLIGFMMDVLLCRGVLNVTEDQLLEEAFKIFKFLIFCILANLAINEAFYDLNSDLLHEIKSESAYLAFFIVSFILCYYFGWGYGKITNNTVPKVMAVRVWLMIALITTILLQLTGILNPGHSSKSEIDQIIVSDIAGMIVGCGLLFIFQFYRLYRVGVAKWYDAIFYATCYSLYIILLSIKSTLIQSITA